MPSDFGITRSLDVRLSFHTKESSTFSLTRVFRMDFGLGANESRTSKKAFGSKFDDPKAVFGAFRPKPKNANSLQGSETLQ